MSVTKYSQGTHYSDGLRTGPIFGSNFVPGRNIFSPSSMVQTPLDQEPPGIFNAPITAYNVIPVSVDFDRIFPIGVALPGYLELASETDEGITILNYQGIPNVIKLDCPRTLTIDGLNVGTQQSQFDIYGWDQYGMPMVERIAGPVGANQVLGKKAFLYIRTIYSSADTEEAVTIGVGNTFGLPYLIPNKQCILSVLWEDALDSGDFIVGDQREATAVTGDVRGTYTPSSGADSETMLSVYFYNWSGDAQNYNLANTGSKILSSEPLASVNGQAVIRVFYPNHQLIQGQSIKISGATAFANITADELNISTTVSSIIDENSFEYISDGIANVTDTSGGGALVLLSPERGSLYATTVGRFGVDQFYVDPV